MTREVRPIRVRALLTGSGVLVGFRVSALIAVEHKQTSHVCCHPDNLSLNPDLSLPLVSLSHTNINKSQTPHTNWGPFYLRSVHLEGYQHHNVAHNCNQIQYGRRDNDQDHFRHAPLSINGAEQSEQQIGGGLVGGLVSLQAVCIGGRLAILGPASGVVEVRL